jgi:competence protein ComEC
MPLLIVFHPVGAGHAVHVFTPAGEVIVIDAGASKDVSPLSWLRRQTSRIDQLIISHPHGDHIEEIERLSNFTVGRLIRPANLDERSVRAQNQARIQPKLDVYFDLDRRFNLPITGQPIGASSDVVLETFTAVGDARANLNNHSLVVSITYGGCTAILPGDNEPSSWQALSLNSSFVARLEKCHLFLASHHGRESGYCGQTFSRLLKPRLCVISDGCVRDTDAGPKYSQLATGHRVVSGSGSQDTRNCVTTRDDGLVSATVDIRPDDTYLTVRVSNG